MSEKRKLKFISSDASGNKMFTDEDTGNKVIQTAFSGEFVLPPEDPYNGIVYDVQPDGSKRPRWGGFMPEFWGMKIQRPIRFRVNLNEANYVRVRTREEMQKLHGDYHPEPLPRFNFAVSSASDKDSSFKFGANGENMFFQSGHRYNTAKLLHERFAAVGTGYRRFAEIHAAHEQLGHAGGLLILRDFEAKNAAMTDLVALGLNADLLEIVTP